MFLIVLLIGLFSASIHANIMVTPSRAEVKLTKPYTQVFSVYNKGDQPVNLAVEPYYKEVDKNSLLDPATAGRDDLTPYIKIAPKVIKVGPKMSRSIRVAIRPTEALRQKKGEYKVHIMFKNIDPDSEVIAKQKDKKAKDKPKDVLSLSGQLKISVAVPIYASIGQEKVELKTECYIENDVPTIKVINYGLWRFDGWVKFYTEKDVELFESRMFLPRGSFQKVERKAKASPVPMKVEYVPLDKNKPTMKGNLCVFTEKKAIQNKVEEQKPAVTEPKAVEKKPVKKLSKKKKSTK